MDLGTIVKKQVICIVSVNKKKQQEITILFHNGAKFDFRLIIEYLASKCSKSYISRIAHNMETFLTFSINTFNGTKIKINLSIHLSIYHTHLIVL